MPVYRDAVRAQDLFACRAARYHHAMRNMWRWTGYTGYGLAMLCTLWAAPGYAQVGIVLTVEGDVSVVSGKQECGLRYGLDLEEGDTVRTGEKSWAMLSLLDGARITVRPSTEVRIEAYRYTDSGDAPENFATLMLVRGSLRAVTGAIARGRNVGYRVRTPEVTLEMRGTDHDITHVAPQFTPVGDASPGSYGKTHAGVGVIKNSRGEVTLSDGQTAFAALRANTPPRLLSADPLFFGLHAYIDRRAAAVGESASKPFLQ